jgi:hypothetical protein
MKVDEQRVNVLTKIIKNKKGEVTKTESDHNIVETDLNIKWDNSIPKHKVEMYNLKNEECQKKFKKYTNITNMANIIDSKKHLDIVTKKFLKRLDGAIIHCFKKIRDTKNTNNKLEQLYEQLNDLKNNVDKVHQEEIELVQREIANEATKIVKEETKGLNSEEGGKNPGHLWKLKSKIIPKTPQVPTAMIGPNGKLLTTKEELEEHTVKHYQDVLRNRTIKPNLENHRNNKNNLCKVRLELTKSVETPDWTRDELLKVLKEVKKKKSRDPNNFANEIFNPEVASEDLITAILKLMNRIKSEGVYPKCLELCNITSLYKQKGPINDFGSHRGIFRVQALRNILERLIYNDEYEEIDSNLTDCNVGARKQRNVCDNIFVLNAVMNDAVNGHKEAVDIAIYDVEKCFDSLWLEECINDIYDLGLKNNKLNILYLMNQNA